MKRYLLLLIVIIGCDNPLDKVYEPSTFRTDFRAIKDYDTLAANSIEYVLEFESPEIGATYQEIFDRYNPLKEEQRIADSIKRAADSIKRIADSLYNVYLKKEIELQKIEREKRREAAIQREREYQRRRAPIKKEFIELLDKWFVEGRYRKIIIEEFDGTAGNLKIGEVKLIGSKLSIDIGPRTLYTYVNLVKVYQD